MNIIQRLFTIKKYKGYWYWGLSDKEIRFAEQIRIDENKRYKLEMKKIKDKFKELRFKQLKQNILDNLE